MQKLEDFTNEIWRKSPQEIINDMSKFGAGTMAYDLSTRVLQYKYLEKTERSTRNLAKATWALGGITAFLVIVTIFK